jgi:hypothetical protein
MYVEPETLESIEMIEMMKGSTIRIEKIRLIY